MRVPGNAVYGYGDANADFHVVGDHPKRHGGFDTGVPFTDSIAGVRLQRVLAGVGLTDETYTDPPDLTNTYLSYLYPAVRPGKPTAEEYTTLERFLDAELRAINAHIILPVGNRPLEYALREHTSLWAELPHDAETLHATEIRGRGFLLIPVAHPDKWTRSSSEKLKDTLSALLNSDYRQTKGVATTIG
jgi:uracil-DNA glycosylase family 4